METKYPEIEAHIIGEDGNAFSVLGIVKRALTRGGVSSAEVDAFMNEAMSGDYNHLLRTCSEWVVVC